jgi:heterodisulfide reductase subunit A2
VVLSVGAELFDPAVLDNFGGGQYPNVVTGLQYERIMSASGPTAGELVRPSDGVRPKKVAWIQCVGSRGINRADVPYCSSVCCMYALKEAIVTKERFASDIEASIFYMDMRTCGKDYELYLNRAKNEYGVQLIRSRPHSVVEDAPDRQSFHHLYHG